MIGARFPTARNQAVISLTLVVIALLAAWKTGGWIARGDTRTLAFAVLATGVVAVLIAIVKNWRSGFYLFLIWLLFEDLVRKYLGNNMAVYFGKDLLVGFTYLSLLLAIRRGRDPAFRPPFLLLLSLFFWLGVLQVFNPNSPNVLYGVLGLKLYFYYVPLMFVGYALIRSDEDLTHFLNVNLGLAAVISILGIIQAIVGPSFLNPVVLAPEIRQLGEMEKYTPISGQLVSLPSSVFVSSGRFGWYLELLCILGLGAAGYMLLCAARGRKMAFAAIGLIAAAIVLSGSRGALVFSCASALVLSAAFLWGARWRWQQTRRLARAIRWSFMMAGLAVTAIVFFFPSTVGSRLDFYSETLSPNSPAFEMPNRAWDYPIHNLMLALADSNWVVGNGTGTASLGVQYVSKLLGQRPPELGVESGFGTLIVEMGILGPILWLLWSVALLFTAWKVVRQLRQTRFLPIAFSIFWLAFLVLIAFTYESLAAYQNYVLNAYLWLLVGVLFRLPDLATSPAILAAAAVPCAKSRRLFSR